MRYFVATELFICNFCCRCFFWEESQLDIRDLEGVPVLVVLESDDLIVQVPSNLKVAKPMGAQLDWTNM